MYTSDSKGFVLGKIDCIKLARRIIPGLDLVVAKEIVETFFFLFTTDVIDRDQLFWNLVNLLFCIKEERIAFVNGRFEKKTVVILDPENFYRNVG